MKLFGTGVFIGVSQRTASNGKVYSNVNIDFDGEVQSLGASDAGPFLNLEKYKSYTFILNYRAYQKDGRTQNFLALEGIAPQQK